MHYTVWFTNTDESNVGGAAISWCVTVSADSESDALRKGMADARVLNREFGLPPNGTRVSEDELQKLASVQPMWEI